MRWIGLTGGIATGKSTVSKILRDLGLPVVDADVLARVAVQAGSEGLKKIVSHFGNDILTEQGELNRQKLGEIIFRNEEKRLLLENILHPTIQELRAKERRNLEQQGCEIAFYDVPLLFEKNLSSEFDATVLVYSKESEQRSRLKERDGLTDEQIEMRLKSQMPIDEKLKKANFVIFNHSGISDLKLNVQTVINDILTGASRKK
jgi:dephospho-CoA kinase